jgi:hypothetical protein
MMKRLAIILFTTALFVCHEYNIQADNKQLSADPNVSIVLSDMNKVVYINDFTVDSGRGIYGMQYYTLVEFIKELHEYLYGKKLKVYDYASLPTGKYNISVQYKPNEDSDCWEKVVNAFEKTYGVKIEIEKQEMDVSVLSCLPSKALILTKDINDDNNYEWGSDGAGGINIKHLKMDQFVIFLEEQILNTPVINETGLQGTYVFTLKMTFNEPQKLKTALNNLGLDLTKTKREIEIIAIRKKAN